MKTIHNKQRRTHFRVLCNREHVTGGYVLPGVGVTFSFPEGEMRRSIEAAAIALHRNEDLVCHTAGEGLYNVERVTL